MFSDIASQHGVFKPKAVTGQPGWLALQQCTQRADLSKQHALRNSALSQNSQAPATHRPHKSDFQKQQLEKVRRYNELSRQINQSHAKRSHRSGSEARRSKQVQSHGRSSVQQPQQTLAPAHEETFHTIRLSANQSALRQSSRFKNIEVKMYELTQAMGAGKPAGGPEGAEARARGGGEKPNSWSRSRSIHTNALQSPSANNGRSPLVPATNEDGGDLFEGYRISGDGNDYNGTASGAGMKRLKTELLDNDFIETKKVTLHTSQTSKEKIPA